MPAVGMRRSTRVFGARVLRSGRRLSTAEPGEVWKQQHQTRSAGHVEDDLADIFKDSNSVEGKKLRKEKNGRHNVMVLVDDEPKEMDVDEKTVEGAEGRRWGAVYQRKRKGLNVKDDFGKRYGRQFSRQRVKRRRGSEAVCQVQITRTGVNCFAVFLDSVLSYMSRVNVTSQQLSAFLLSEPICSVYDLHGIHFLQDSTFNARPGVCRIMDSRCSVPMFALDYSALPSVFMFFHTSLLIRSATLPITNGMEVNCDSMSDDEEISSHRTCGFDFIGGETGVAVYSTSERRALPSGAPKSVTRLTASSTMADEELDITQAKMNIGATRAHGIVSAITRSSENVAATAVDFKNFSRNVKKQIGKHDTYTVQGYSRE
uniref:Uncharacterized protein n=1 Tax=Daucus carota subsp. sativus TaxID=79200 RepID=A0A166DPV2_DAUCS